MTPRDYQQENHDAILAAWGEKPWYKAGEETYRSVVSNMPTSAGKTIVAGMVCLSVHERGRCLYLADTDELCDQPLKKFAKLGIHASLEKAESRASRNSTIVIGSAQTLARRKRLERFSPDHFQYIFVDEAHRGSDRNKAITDYFPDAKVCGQTATAFRAKLKDLSKYYEHVAFELGVFDLVDEGYIPPLKVLTLPVKVDITQVKQSAGFDGQDFDKDELSTTIRPYYEAIIHLIREHAANRQIVCYLPLIRSSQDFVAIARALGINARHIDGQSPDRKQLLERFERRDFQLLSNSSLLTTGWDCPPCDCLLNLAPTRSPGLFRQKVGRVLRPLPGVIDGITNATERKARIASSAKPDALILDLLWQSARFGLAGPADLIAANDEQKEALQLKLRGLTGAFNLQGVSAEVQAEKEKALKEALERAAKWRSAGAVDAKMFAVAMHDNALLEYEPVTEWQATEMSTKQAAFLLRNGIDPASVKDKGHASALTNKIFGRRMLGLAAFRTVQALEAHGIKDAIRWKERAAYEHLRGDYPFPFGRPAAQGQLLRQVNSGYWDWLSRQDWVREAWPILWEHMEYLGVVAAPGHAAQVTRAAPKSDPLVPLSYAGDQPTDDQIPF